MKLKDWRKTSGLTGRDAAQRIGVAQPTWSQYENGFRRPSPEIAARIEALSSGQVTAAELLGISGHPERHESAGTRGMSESPAPFGPEDSAGPKSMAELRAERLAPQPVTVSVPKDLLELSRKYGLDVEVLLAEGGLPRLREVFKQAYMEHNREGIEWTNEYVRKYGTLSEQLGMI
ncbi:MAG: helix-turn-helix domain-containing protein [Hyphomonadaceae bacterium]|nr:helix-turn-helix domain-containing protein [Hyphomonadaceae bacterium]